MALARDRVHGRVPADAGSLPSDEVLLDFPPLFLTGALPREGLLGAALVAGLQVKGVFLDVLDDVFLLNLPLEAAQRALDRLAFLNFHFCHGDTPPSWPES
jgi:hypothetical protein